MSGNGDGLVKPDGTPLVKEPRLIVLKQPKGIRLNQQAITQLCKMTGCDVFIVPMDCEIMMGKIALQELESIHRGIHAILELGPVDDK